MNSTELRFEIDSTLSELLEVVSDIDESQFNIAKDENSWSSAQVVQHLVLSISAFVKLMKGATLETNRNPDEHIERIKEIFLNFDKKLKSPEFIIPEKKEYNKEDLLRALKELKSELENIFDTSDLDKTCTAFGLPTLGNLTRKEALAFVLYHTQRHVSQLKTAVRRPQTTDRSPQEESR
jgi:uncharacterized damage-inducible protein DinB